MIVTAPHSNEIDEEIFLGRIAGSLIKRTKVAVLVAPLDKKFSPPKKMLLAFKSGEVRSSNLLDTMIRIQDEFKVKLKLSLATFLSTFASSISGKSFISPVQIKSIYASMSVLL